MASTFPRRSSRVPGRRRLRLWPAVAAVLLLALTSLGAVGQEVGGATSADTADVGSIDALIGAVYDVISGPAGEPRDWSRFRSLFAPGARLIPTGRTQQGVEVLRTMTPQQYIEGSGPFLEERGFFERELNRVVERYGNIAHVFSTYESRWAPETEPFDHGINSFQLWHDGERWWVVSILWDAESSGTEVPEDYRPARP